jgi:tRNA pseudouridine55 synthase
MCWQSSMRWLRSSLNQRAPTNLKQSQSQSQNQRQKRPQVPQITGGFLNVNKDPGMTSMDVLRNIKRITGQKKVGHGGTLDPDATGVLPVAIGKATRFLELVLSGRKTYVIMVNLGSATNTYDASGEVTDCSDASGVTREMIETALDSFRGDIEQVPPMFSALKRDGVPLYKLARQGIEVEREARPVTVYRLSIASWDHPEFRLEIDCSSGFYARSLAHDVGKAVGTHAHLTTLVRTKASGFEIGPAVSLADLEELASEDRWQDAILPIDVVLPDLPSVAMNPLTVDQIRNGQSVRASLKEIDATKVVEGDLVRVYDSEGMFIATAQYDPTGPWWKPDKVISPA